MRSVAVSVVRLVVQLAAVAAVLGSVSDITDLAIFSSLAPCAASAVSAVVEYLTAAKCPSGVTALQSCACTQDNNSAAIATTISNSILRDFCTSTASDDVSSASVVFSYYCNQAGAAPSFSNAAASVSQYITDLAAYSALAPCAYLGLSNAVQGLTNELCPTAQAALASCACSKNQNSLVASNSISSAVFDECGSTHSADISSAEAVFAGYCGLAAGTTSFPTASALPGHLTYYVTDLPQFSSLAPCAASAVSVAILDQTSLYCPSDPQDLVSCVCVKDSNSLSISRFLSSEVKELCDSTASEDISSGIALLDFYCSAGEGLVTPTGITNSVQVTGYSNGGGAAATTGATSAAATGLGPRPSTPQKTSTSGSNGGSSGSDGSNNPLATSSSSSTSNVPIIAGVAGGVVGVIAIIVIIWAIWFCQRRKRMRMTAMPLITPPPVNEKTYFPGGKSELDNTPLVSDMPPQHNRGLSTPTPNSAVSPDSIYARPAAGKPSELSPQNGTIRTAASSSVAEMSGRSLSEMQGQGIAVSTPGPNPDAYEMQDYGGQTVYGQALGGASPYGLKDSGGPPYAQVQGSASPGPQYAQVQGAASPGPGVTYAPYYGQGYGPPQSQYPNPNPSQGPYEMPSQRWG